MFFLYILIHIHNTEGKEKDMKNKQILGIVVAGVVFIAVSVTGMFSNVVKDKMMESQKSSTTNLFGSLSDTIAENKIALPDNDFVGVINISGTIEASSTGAFDSYIGNYDHNLYLDYIQKMEESSSNKGILLLVDSPGGAVYQSDEMYLRLMQYKEKTKRPVYAYFESQACSGAYYISMAADKIYANRNCWTGSIGVIVSMTNLKGLYDKVGIQEIDITSGKNKSMGSSGQELTEEQREILQGLVDEAYDQFTQIVAQGRNMDIKTVKKLADGRIYSALQAKENGLIDEVGSLESQKEAMLSELGISKDTQFYELEKSSGWLSSLMGSLSSVKTKSELEVAEDIVDNQGNGVLMYYAK